MTLTLYDIFSFIRYEDISLELSPDANHPTNMHIRMWKINPRTFREHTVSATIINMHECDDGMFQRATADMVIRIRNSIEEENNNAEN